MAYWLVKSEPSSWSWDQQVAKGAKGEAWTGVRNFTARQNLVKMKKGDRAFFYHSNEGKEIVGIAEIIKEAYPDPTDKTGKFVCVDIKADKPLKTPVTMAAIKADKHLAEMALVKYSRLSVQPVTADEWKMRLQDGRDVALLLRRRSRSPKGEGEGRGRDALLTKRNVRRRRRHHLRQKRFALRLRAVALHGRRETFEDAVLEGGDDGIVDVALAADRRRVGKFVGGGAHGVQHLLLAAAGACRRRNPRQQFQHHGGCHQGAEILQRNLDAGDLAQERVDRAWSRPPARCLNCRDTGTYACPARRAGCRWRAPVWRRRIPCARPCRPWP